MTYRDTLRYLLEENAPVIFIPIAHQKDVCINGIRLDLNGKER